MFRLCLFILFVAALIEIQADDSRIVKKDKLRLCGRRLPEMLRFVCKSKYYGKRSEDYNKLNTDYEFNDNVQDLEEYYSYPFRTRLDAFSFIPDGLRNRGQKRGIVDECCRHSCSIDELRAYCE